MPSGPTPTLYLGKIAVSGDDGSVNFGDYKLFARDPTTDTNLATKQYVDAAVKVNDSVEMDKIKADIASEISDRLASETIFQNKIDMLFKYFFHRSSTGASIDDANQISFTSPA